jgi:hypothetical protein
VGPWTGSPTIFNGNIYFKLLLKSSKDGADYWTADPRAKKFQYKDPSGTLMMLPSDLVLVQDSKFLPIVQMYAKDKALFYVRSLPVALPVARHLLALHSRTHLSFSQTDFAAAFQKLLELGCKDLTPVDA